MGLKPNEMLAAAIIVVFVVLVIAMGLYPAMQGAPTNQCLSNLAVMLKAVDSYALDYDATCGPADRWAEVLFPNYLEDTSRLLCPSARLTPEQQMALNAGGSAGLPVGYALLRPLAGEATMRIAKPDLTPFIFDSNEIRPNATADVDSLAFRHTGKKANIGFADGHGASVTAAPALPKPLLLPEGTPPPRPLEPEEDQ